MGVNFLGCAINQTRVSHPRRPRGSQSGREKRRDESFQAQTDCLWVSEDGLSKQDTFITEASLRSADVFPVVAFLPPKNNGGREATTENTSALRRLNGSLFCHKKSFQVLSWQKLQRDTPTWTGTINYNCKRFSDYFRTGKFFQIKIIIHLALFS